MPSTANLRPGQRKSDGLPNGKKCLGCDGPLTGRQEAVCSPECKSIVHGIKQPTLFDLAEPEYEPEMTLQERFEAFHAANPAVYAELRRRALRLRRRGVRRWSIKGLFEGLRFDAAIVTNGKPYRLNNNLTSGYSRLLMETTPELEDFFETRTRRAGRQEVA